MRTPSPLAVLVPLFAVVVGCGQAPPVAAPAPVFSTPDPNRSDWPNQSTLNNHAQIVQKLGERKYRDVFAGVEIDLYGDRIIVYRLPNPAFDRAVQAVISGRVTLRDAQYSEAQLYAWQATLHSDYTYWQRRDIPLHTIGRRPGGTCVEVGVEDPDRHGTVLRDHYPNIPLCVAHSMGMDLLNEPSP
ncbi:hypothetical protein ACWDV4_20145 [Micromonospora sp. NPDC003197]